MHISARHGIKYPCQIFGLEKLLDYLILNFYNGKITFIQHLSLATMQVFKHTLASLKGDRACGNMQPIAKMHMSDYGFHISARVLMFTSYKIGVYLYH